jgi:hypothetical protein
MNLTITDILTVVLTNCVTVPVLQFIISKWFMARLKHDFDRKLEDYRSEIRRREQAARVAKLLALSYRPDAKPHEFNELAWELSLWLPPELVRELSRCLCGADGAMSPKDILIAIRKLLLQNASDDLTADQIVHREYPHGRADLTESLIKDPTAKSLAS